ncbi:hypothetical protein V6Z11_D02G098500 [Gossypium hirsutum]
MENASLSRSNKILHPGGPVTGRPPEARRRRRRPPHAVAGKEAWGANGMGSARFWAEEEVGAAWSRTWGNGARNPRVSGFPKNFLETWAYRALGF